jgi:PAS domain S-box-containing protein
MNVPDQSRDLNMSRDADRARATGQSGLSESGYRTLVDHASDGFYLSDDQSIIIDVNRAACQMLGYSREELLGKHPREFDVGLDDAAIARLSRRVLDGETITFETLHRRRDGSIFPVEIRGRGFEQDGRRLLLALVRDITERKAVETTLREKEQALQNARTELARVSRLTTLGELTTSIAHEVSQPLGAMVAGAGACARWLEADPPAIAEARAALDNIIADGKRAREVIARIRALTRRQTPRKDRLDIDHEIFDVLALMKQEISSQDIVLRTDLGTMAESVIGDRVQLQQVLLNLILNAIEAMSAVQDRQRELTIVSRQESADTVLVEVRDNGTGLKSEDAEQLFEAFYSTKVEGIGIGLAISRSIVEAHGGRLTAAANEPHGAIFRFSLPVAHEALT